MRMSECWSEVSLQRFELTEGPPGPEVPQALVARAQARLKTAFYSDMTGSADSTGKRKHPSFQPKKEVDMHLPVCETVNDALSPTPYIAKDTAEHVEDSFIDHKPDFAIYYSPRNQDGTPQEYPGRRAWELSDEEVAKSVVSEERKPHLARSAWAWVICAIELKNGISSDPFDDANLPRPLPDCGVAPTFRTGENAKRARTQLIRYATEMLVRQPRVFVYTVLIARNTARLMRWDRCGAVVTEAFDYIQNPKPLLNFFYRLARASPRAQGFDTSVSLATKAQIDELYDYRRQLETSQAPGAVYEKEFIDEMKEDPDLYPFRQLEVPVFNRDSKSQPQPDTRQKSLTLIIGKRRTGIFSPVGRGTVGYIAYVVGQRKLVFLKDTWRGDSPGIPEELETYRKLYELGVDNIPRIVAGGDVLHEKTDDYPDREQYTRNQEYLSTKDENIIRRKHYRLVTETLGLPLTKYHNSHAMVHVIRDALKAHRGAWANGKGVLHRDISIGNILIDIRSPNILQFPRGILTDWDLSRGVDEDDDRQPSQYIRSGTWAFMSGPLLRYPIKPHWVADDLESFIHVMDFLTLQNHHHSLTKPPMVRRGLKEHKALSSHVMKFFYDESTQVYEGREYDVGGDRKFEVYNSNNPQFHPYWLTQQSVFSELMQVLHTLCRDHYHSTAVRELPTKYPEFAGAPPAALQQKPSYFIDVLSVPGTTQAPFVPDPLSNHEQICSYIDRALNVSAWPEDDKIADQFTELKFVNAIPSRGLSSYERRAKKQSSGGSRASSSKPRKAKKTKKAKKAKVEANVPSTSTAGHVGDMDADDGASESNDDE